MKIGLFIGGLSGGGAERVCCNLANYLIECGNEVEVITMADDSPSYFISHDVIRKILLTREERTNVVFDSLRRLIRLIKILKCEKLDCIIVMLPITTIFLLSLKRFFKGAIIAAERNDPSIYPHKKQRSLRRLAHRAEGWIFQTEEQRSWYGNSVGNAITTIIPNAISADFIKPTYTGVRKPIIVNSGRFTNQKNQALLIRAFAKISQKFPEYILKIYGDGPLRKDLILLSESLNIADKVEFPGYVENIAQEIECASLFVLTSEFEGMPNALMEAMALGLPCISTDCDGGGAKYLIADGVNGLLIPKDNVESLVNGMNRILSDLEFANKIGKEAHTICERLRPDKIYADWKKVIDSILTDCKVQPK